MAVIKELEVWLSRLHETVNFEPAFRKIFQRILNGEGHGLIILQGPSKTANKSYFLNTVKAFQKGVPAHVRRYFSSGLQRLLAEIDTSHYQCVDIEEDCPIQPYSNVHRVPLNIALPLSLVSASLKRGLKKGHKTVVLCNDLQEFIPHIQESNIAFLKQFAELTRNHGEITLVCAYTLDYGKGLEATTLSTYVQPLGYD